MRGMVQSFVLTAFVLASAACSSNDSTPPVDDITLKPVDDSPDGTDDGADNQGGTPVVAPDGGRADAGTGGAYVVGAILETTGNVNFRSDPSTTNSPIRVLPLGTRVQVVQAEPQNGFVNVHQSGTDGWVSAKYLKPVGDTGPINLAPSRAEAIALAKTAVGFSYYWGHGRWLTTGVTGATRGTCSGSCPSCTHDGAYGADCSGFVAKLWKIPASNTDVATDSHPYSTADFVGPSSLWKTVTRTTINPGDALTYNSGGHGHIFLYESGDAWGSMWAYEARGCSEGVVHNLRSAGSDYKVIARSTF